MKYLALAFIALIIMSGCESGPKTLDWDKTASEQKFEVEDTIIVEGIAKNIVEYEYKKRKVIGDGELARPYIRPATLRATEWTSQISVPLYNPEQPNVKVNPNVPIGSVICTIYNPNLNNSLLTLFEETYPHVIKQETREEALRRSRVEQYVPDYNQKITAPPNIQHRFRITGSIQNIGRKTVRGVSLQCIDITVSELTVISSEKLPGMWIWGAQPPFFWESSNY